MFRLLQSKDDLIECPEKEKRSSIWKTFGHPKMVKTGEILKNFAVCKNCSRVYNYDSKTGNTPLNNHKFKGGSSTRNRERNRVPFRGPGSP